MSVGAMVPAREFSPRKYTSRLCSGDSKERENFVNPHPLLEMVDQEDVADVNGFCRVASTLTGEKLAEFYRVEVANAPSLPSENAKFFIGHDGKVANPEKVKFDRDHLAMALWNHYRQNGARMGLADGTELEILDYNVVFASPKDKETKLRKFDLLALSDEGRVAVIALRYMTKKSTKGDTPLQLLLEGLAACAVAQARQDALQTELAETFSRDVSTEMPLLIVAANSRYWDLYRRRAAKAAGPWLEELERIGREIEASVGIAVRFVNLDLTGDPSWELRGSAPTLLAKPRVYSALKEKTKLRSKSGVAATIAARVEADPSRPVRPYSMRETYQPGDVVEHSTFGQGIVQSVSSPLKVEILFGNERRLLAQGKQ